MQAVASDRQVFLAHLAKLVAWLRKCVQPSVHIPTDILAKDYSEDFVQFLSFRFPIIRGWADRSPAMFLRSLAATAGGLHDLPNGGLLLVEMFDSLAPADPMQLRTYIDERNVRHIEFICQRTPAPDPDEDEGGQVVTLTNLTADCFWTQATCGYGGINADGDKIPMHNCKLDDSTWGTRSHVRGASNGRYGTTTRMSLGSFDDETQSDFIEVRNDDHMATVVVHRIAPDDKRALPRNAKERDPVAYAAKKEQFRIKLGHEARKSMGSAARPPCRCAEAWD
jgi:hypothetical protein